MQYYEIVATVIITGAVQAVITVGAIKVHIAYLKSSTERAHVRIDDIIRGIDHGSRA